MDYTVWLRRAVGVIFQDFFRYDMAARTNIAVGRIEAIVAGGLHESYPEGRSSVT